MLGGIDMPINEKFDIEKEARRRTPWGQMLRVLLNSDFRLCYNWIIKDNSELIFCDRNRALLLYAYSHGPYVDTIRIYGELAINNEQMTPKQKEALWWVNYLIAGENYCFFESSAKGYLNDFIKKFIPAFDFCNPWHSTLDHVNLCNPTEVGYPGARYPKMISDSKINLCEPLVNDMIPNKNKTDWFSSIKPY